LPFELTVQARVLQEANVSGIDWSFGFLVDDGMQRSSIGIGVSSIYSNSIGGSSGKVLASGLDNTVFHEYRVVGTPGVGGSVSVFRDGMLVGTDTDIRITGGVNFLAFGDVTEPASSAADIRKFEFCQVPEPATITLLGLGAVGCLGFGWRHRKRATLAGR
jgi:hypothetical protein